MNIHRKEFKDRCNSLATSKKKPVIPKGGVILCIITMNIQYSTFQRFQPSGLKASPAARVERVCFNWHLKRAHPLSF